MRALSFGALGFFLILAALVLMPLFIHGTPGFDLNYLLAEPETMGRSGGIGPILVSTLLVNGLAVVITIFLGVPAALALHRLRHSGRHFYQGVTAATDILAGTPSIVFGLFGNAFFVDALGFGYSILAGSLTLVLMILPLFVSVLENALNAIPKGLFWSARSLGLSNATIARRILLPTVHPALLAALALSWTRAIGEAAALLFTAGYSMRWPESLFDSGRPLAVHIFDLSLNVTGADPMAYRAGLVLILMTTVFISVVRWHLRKWNPV